MKKKILLFTTVAMMGLAACSSSQPAATEATTAEASTEAETEAEKKVVKPLPCEMDIDNLDDGIYSAALNLDTLVVDEENEETYLTCEVYIADLYDAVDITTLAEGDVVVVDGKEIEVVTAEDENGSILVNGGNDNGGVNFAAGEGGTYRVNYYDDATTYTDLGELEIYIDEDTVLIDDSEVFNAETDKDKSKTIKSDEIADYLQNVEDNIFDQRNTTITFEDGYLTEIHRVFVP